MISSVSVKADRTVIDLSGYNWGLYRDFNASWIDDEIYLPPVDIASLPENSPTCGWQALKNHIEKTVHLPATVEEHFWGENGNTEGVAGDWRGVSWWVTTVPVDTELRGKRVFLDFESVHLLAEVFVNRTLAGYDAIGHTPFSVDITDMMRAGEHNEIAVRVTDPLGNFNWNDRPVMKWGTHDVPACHGFGGITGGVFLRAVDPVYIDDIFVKNKPAIKEIDLLITTKNAIKKQVSGKFSVHIYPWGKPDDIIWNKTFKRDVDISGREFVFTVGAPRAK